MLFGRRKKGFVKEVDEMELDLTGEFSDKNDPAVLEKKALDALEENEETDEKVDLFDFMKSIPDEDEVPIIEENEEEEIELTKAQLLAQYIRESSLQAQIISYLDLKKQEDELDVLLEELKQDPNSADIVYATGDKDNYYYSNQCMSDNYAMIAVLVYEKDLVKLIAKMVRFNAETYPAPTPYTYFIKHPYFMSKAQINRALDVIFREEAYQDIKMFRTGNNARYLHSTKFMSEVYALALAEDAEYGEGGYTQFYKD